jgi:hypothetical protein
LTRVDYLSRDEVVELVEQSEPAPGFANAKR